MASSLRGMFGGNQSQQSNDPLQYIQQMKAQGANPLQITMQLKMMGVNPNQLIQQMMGAGMVTQQQYDAAAAQAPNIKL